MIETIVINQKELFTLKGLSAFGIIGSLASTRYRLMISWSSCTRQSNQHKNFVFTETKRNILYSLYCRSLCTNEWQRTCLNTHSTLYWLITTAYPCHWILEGIRIANALQVDLWMYWFSLAVKFVQGCKEHIWKGIGSQIFQNEF